MVDVDVLKAQLVRQDASEPWGFRLSGGADSNTPLTIALVTAGSAAHRIGLQSNDEIVEIEDTSTEALTQQQAEQLINTPAVTLLMTVERKVPSGSGRYLMHKATANIQPTTIKDYQPMNMTGSYRPTHRTHTQVLPLFKTVESRPFESHRAGVPTTTVYYETQQPAPPHSAEHQWHSATDTQRQQQAYYDLAEDSIDGRLHHNDVSAGPQSRTFRMLQSVMHNEEPAAGVSGLPPPRSAAMEQMKRQQQPAASQRVKVFMPQQYNSPMGMYSAHNVLETFTAQAGTMLDNIDRRQPPPGQEYSPIHSSNY